MGTISISRRFHESESSWLSSFALDSLKVLVVCRGPVRMEAFEIFQEIGIREFGMLLSEKDSVVYPRCLAPEIRSLSFPANIHRVPDYTGSGQQEKIERISQIIRIAIDHNYTHIFAGYGFMAEDADFIAHLPLQQARALVSTIPQREVNALLLRAARSAGFRGSVTLSAFREGDLEAFNRAGAASVLASEPFPHEQTTALDQPDFALAGRAGRLGSWRQSIGGSVACSRAGEQAWQAPRSDAEAASEVERVSAARPWRTDRPCTRCPSASPDWSRSSGCAVPGGRIHG